MKKLLALKNICTIQTVFADLTSRDVAYTEKLLELNVILDFSGVPIADKEDFRDETHLFATIYRDTRFYHYTLFTTTEVLGPLIITRLIVDAVEFIETLDKETVIEGLKEIATDYTTVDETSENEIYKITLTEYYDAMRMIQKKHGKS